MIRSMLIGTAIAVLSTSAFAGSSNTATVVQVGGKFNYSAIGQSGRTNSALVVQAGRPNAFNYSGIAQRGRTNAAAVGQAGKYNTSVISQGGLP